MSKLEDRTNKLVESFLSEKGLGEKLHAIVDDLDADQLADVLFAKFPGSSEDVEVILGAVRSAKSAEHQASTILDQVGGHGRGVQSRVRALQDQADEQLDFAHQRLDKLISSPSVVA